MNRRQLLQGLSAGGLLGAAKFTQAESIVAMPEKQQSIEVVSSMGEANDILQDNACLTNQLLEEIVCQLTEISCHMQAAEERRQQL